MFKLLPYSFAMLIGIVGVTMAQEEQPAGKSAFIDPIQSFELSHLNAQDVYAILNNLFPQIAFSVEPKSNRIYARVNDAMALEIKTFLATIDQKSKNQKLPAAIGFPGSSTTMSPVPTTSEIRKRFNVPFPTSQPPTTSLPRLRSSGVYEFPSMDPAEKEAQKIAAEIRGLIGDDAAEDEVSRAQEALKKVLLIALEVKLKKQEAEIDAAQTRLDVARQRLDNRRNNAEKVVAKRLEDLLSAKATTTSYFFDPPTPKRPVRPQSSQPPIQAPVETKPAQPLPFKAKQ